MKTVKRKSINGYTLLEMLLVLFILSLTSLIFVSTSKNHYDQFILKLWARKISLSLSQAKFDSLMLRQLNVFEFESKFYTYNDSSVDYPSGITLVNPIKITFNKQGNVNKAYSLELVKNKQSIRIVIHLGGGNNVIKEE